MAEEVDLRIRKKGTRRPPAPTHFIYNGVIAYDRGKGKVEVPKFGTGWRAVRLEQRGTKYAHVLETGTGKRTRIELFLWDILVRKGRTL